MWVREVTWSVGVPACQNKDIKIILLDAPSPPADVPVVTDQIDSDVYPAQ